MTLADQLQNALEESDGERSAAAFLKANPEIVRRCFYSVRGHCDYVLGEFPLGSQYKVDLTAITGASGSWESTFIELEPVRDKLVLKDGGYSERIRGAIKQIAEWREFISQRPNDFRTDLSRWARERDLLRRGELDDSDPCTLSGHRLSDVESYMTERFWIVSGRRSEITKKARGILNRMTRESNIFFASYDSFVDAAKVVDEVQSLKS